MRTAFFLELGATIVSLGLLVWCGRSIIRIHRSYPIGLRRWLIIIWVVTAATMVASIIRVWTINAQGPNLGAMFMLLGSSGMTLPGLLFLLGVETNRLVPGRTYTLPIVGSVLAVITALPSVFWTAFGGLADPSTAYRLPLWYWEEHVVPAVFWLFASDVPIRLRLAWDIAGSSVGVSTLVLIVTALIVIVLRIREGHLVRPIAVAVVWMILVFEGLGYRLLLGIGVLLVVMIWSVQNLHSRITRVRAGL